MMKILGIDEAGRGCVIGPLCLCGVITQSEIEEQKLRDWGCKDSKLFGSSELSREKRAELAKKIRDNFVWFEEIISAQTIDLYVTEKSLNLAESEHAEKILKRANFDLAVLDGKNIFKNLENKKIRAENKADEKHIGVAAASILAKDRRDSLLELVFAEAKFPSRLPGGGYVNPKTLLLVKEYFQKHGNLPDHFRRSYRWKKMWEEIPASESLFLPKKPRLPF